MRKSMRFLSSRALWVALAGMFVLTLTGDRGIRAAASYQGIDPLLVLTQQVKNNVLFIIDTSGSMKWPVGVDYATVGDDDPMSRAYTAKKAVRTVVKQHLTDINMGIATYDVYPIDKALNRNQDFDGGNGGDTNGSNDGPFVYVTNDPNAAVWYGNTGNCLDTNANNKGSAGPANQGFFCGLNDTYTNYNPGTLTGTAKSTAYFRQFGNIGTNATGRVDPNCSSGNCTRYYLQSHFFYSGVSFSWAPSLARQAGATIGTALTAGPTTGVTCGTPPAGLTGDWNDDGTTDPGVPCIVFHDNLANKDVTFWYTATITQINVNAWKTGVNYSVGNQVTDSTGNTTYIATQANLSDSTNQPGTAGGAAFWTVATGGTNCKGAAVLSTVAACTANNSQVVLDYMRPAVPIKDVTHLGNDGTIVANATPDYMNTTTPTNVDVATKGWGLRFDQGTPLKASLDDILNANPAAFPARANTNQKNFVILLTDGDDTCADNNLDTAANLASQSARSLFINTDFTHQAQTFVITLGSSATRAGKIAVAGSGGPINTATCPTVGQAGYTTTCTNALSASSVDQLVTALNNAINIATTSGTFAASAAVIGTVFELDDPTLTPSVTASQPGMNRYLQTDNARYLATFDLPAFEGHLIGFRNTSSGTYKQFNSTANSASWDAGSVLKSLITNGSLKLTGGVAHTNANGFTFAELSGNGTINAGNMPPMTSTTTAPAIKRRIFTSQGNGTFPRSTSSSTQWDSGSAAGRNVIALWPPNQTGLTAPGTAGFANGVDPAVGTAGDYDAALGISTKNMTTLKTDLSACDNSSSSPAGSLPANCTGTATQQDNQARKEARQILLAWLAGAQLADAADGKPLRDSSQNLLYVARPFVLLDSVRSTPALSPPPLRGISRPPAVHTAEWSLYTDGLHQSSDLNLGFGQTAPDQSTSDPATLKPRMTTVFMGASDGLHAFSAETGIEMWSYVPFDQLGKIYLLLRDGQTASSHKYMVAASPRTMDVFMPTTTPFTPSGTSNPYNGRWRTVLVFGRGAGGKYYTMLDVTAPGPYTADELATNPPWVLWSRGNPDTIDGTSGGTAVDATDTTAYSKMGETWALPEIGNVGALTPEWRMFVGSGYSANAPTEGSTFYAMDVISGHILFSQDVGQGTRDSVNSNAYNALPANPTGYNASLLDFPDQPATSPDVMTRVYQPDIHGRIWKYVTATGAFGVFASGSTPPTPPNLGGLTENGQPFGNPINLLNQASGGSRHLVFAESGNDNRVSDAAVPFRMFAWDDTAGDATTPKGTLMDSSQKDANGNGANFPIAFPAGFRGSSQPAVAFTAQKAARVFFLGTRFNSASNSNCASSFDSIIFALGAVTGGAAYDFGSSFTINDNLLLNVSTQGGVLSGTSGRPGVGAGGGGGGGCNNLGPGSTGQGAPNQTQVTTKTNSERLGSSTCF